MGIIMARALSVFNRRPVPPPFQRYERGIWEPMAPYLSGQDLMALTVQSTEFHEALLLEGVADIGWKNACVRELQVLDPGPLSPHLSWAWPWIYCSTFDHWPELRHSYAIREPDQEIVSYKRVGGFMIQSGSAYLSTRLFGPHPPLLNQHIADQLQAHGSCRLLDVKNGIWIAEVMLMFEARHIELFIEDGFREGGWTYDPIGFNVLDVVPLVPDLIYIVNPAISFAAVCDWDQFCPLFNLAAWGGDDTEVFTKVLVKRSLYAAAMKQNIEDPLRGLRHDFSRMLNGEGGEVVSIRISLRHN